MLRYFPARSSAVLIVISAAVLAAPPAGSVPATDSRNTDLPGTNSVFRMPQYRTRAEWEKRREALRKQILTAAGLYPLPTSRSSMRTLLFDRIENGDYSVEKIAIETMPGYWLGGNLYRPLGKPGRHPAIASPHGHWNYGRLENTPSASVPARGISLAKLGFVVMTYDMVGYTDTVQTPHAFGDDPKDQLWNFGPLPLQLWNSIRVLDFLQTLPDVDAEQIGATGASGGATQVLLLAAVDERIRFSAPVNMISSIMQGGSPCENAPGLRVNANNMEIGAMMAPRPMMMIAATGDWTKNTPRVEYPAVRSIYDLYDAADKLATKQIQAPHNYNQQSREAVYRFFARTILGRADADNISEKGVRIEKLQDMMVWHGRSLPEGALDFDGVRRTWTSMGRQQIEKASQNPDLMKERLQLTLLSEWPAEVASVAGTAGGEWVLSRAGHGDRVPVVVLGSGVPSRLVVHPNGIAAARTDAKVQNWLHSGETLVLMDAFQTGSTRGAQNKSEKFFLTFNKSDDAERVQDILTVLRWMQTAKGATNLHVTGLDRAQIWAVFAAAAAPVKVAADRPTISFDGSDDAFTREFFVPGMQRAGGWQAALRLAGVL